MSYAYVPKDPCRAFGGHVESYKTRGLPWYLQPDRSQLKRAVSKRLQIDQRNPFTSKVAAPCLRRLMLYQGSVYAEMQHWNPAPSGTIQSKPKRYYSLLIGGTPKISFTCSLEAVSYQKTLAKYISPDCCVVEESV